MRTLARSKPLIPSVSFQCSKALYSAKHIKMVPYARTTDLFQGLYQFISVKLGGNSCARTYHVRGPSSGGNGFDVPQRIRLGVNSPGVSATLYVSKHAFETPVQHQHLQSTITELYVTSAKKAHASAVKRVLITIATILSAQTNQAKTDKKYKTYSENTEQAVLAEVYLYMKSMI